MKPSFLNSTLSLAFILCVLTVIAMIFLWIEMPEYGNEVVIWTISAYLTARGVNSKTEEDHSKSIHDVNDLSERP